jgi:excisionase family DNA binding protein
VMTNAETMPLDRLLTVREAAAWARCHEETIRRAYLAGHLTVRRFGSRNWRIAESDLSSWVAAGMRTRRVA